MIIVKTLKNVLQRKERALVVAVRAGKSKEPWMIDDSIEELRELALGAGADVVGSVVQNLPRPAPTYLGRGKICELKALVAENNVDTVICDDELGPNQQLNLERELGNIKVIDRTALILDVFATRARSKEGRLQVELAQHEYLLPRLAGQWTHLERLGGGIGTRGPGESQIETDRRLARNRIRKLRKDLENVRRHRSRYRSRRSAANLPVVALIGYTNAGKSTILNMLTKSDVVAENRMFSTLDPVTRKLDLPSRSKVLLTDTVGFIQKLPTALVAAFRATLEEATDADLLLHVIDVSHKRRREQAYTVRSIMGDLGLADIPGIILLNKVDKLEPGYDSFEDSALLDLIGTTNQKAIFCSGLTGMGKMDIMQAIQDELSEFPELFEV